MTCADIETGVLCLCHDPLITKLRMHRYKMAAEGSARDRTCSVCLELFSEPKVLPCCHTFCLKCLEKTARSGQKKGEIVCPQCRKTHAIPAGGLTELLTDFVVSYEIEVAALKSSKGVKALVCGECEAAGPLESYCSDCQNYLCHECGSQLHKRLKAYRGHTVVLIKDIDVATSQPCLFQHCATHKGEALRLYCETCTKLICRDCALVDHHQHKYTFVKDARKQVRDEMISLGHTVNKKLDILKHNLQQIKQVETAATGHSEVLKADVNTFFDKLVQSIEGRRNFLLRQVEVECQKDMKQIWADKEFHETFISQILSVFRLAHKSCKCTSDVEMILTALQSIQQLMQLKDREWDGLAFINAVSFSPKFSEGKQVAVDAIGILESSTSSFGLKLSRVPGQTTLGTSIQFRVQVTCPTTKCLVDDRSGTPVDLQGDIPWDLRVIVHYGNSGKELNNAHIHVSTVQKKRRDSEDYVQPAVATKPSLAYLLQTAKAHPMKRAVSSSSPVEDIYNVTIKLVCGGEHTVTFTAGGSKIRHTLTVVGFPPHGVRVKKGPDWKPPQFSSKATDHQDHVYKTSNDEIGTVYGQSSAKCDGDYSRDVVRVREHSGTISEYKWGQGGVYEIELVNITRQQKW